MAQCHLLVVVLTFELPYFAVYICILSYTGDYEVRDYKGRTPLHLAAELGELAFGGQSPSHTHIFPIPFTYTPSFFLIITDRTEAAEYLLSLDKPAECQVSDNLGNTVLVSMIRTMPKVVR